MQVTYNEKKCGQILVTLIKQIEETYLYALFEH